MPQYRCSADGSEATSINAKSTDPMQAPLQKDVEGNMARMAVLNGEAGIHACST